MDYNPDQLTQLIESNDYFLLLKYLKTPSGLETLLKTSLEDLNSIININTSSLIIGLLCDKASLSYGYCICPNFHEKLTRCIYRQNELLVLLSTNNYTKIKDFLETPIGMELLEKTDHELLLNMDMTNMINILLAEKTGLSYSYCECGDYHKKLTKCDKPKNIIYYYLARNDFNNLQEYLNTPEGSYIIENKILDEQKLCLLCNNCCKDIKRLIAEKTGLCYEACMCGCFHLYLERCNRKKNPILYLIGTNDIDRLRVLLDTPDGKDMLMELSLDDLNEFNYKTSTSIMELIAEKTGYSYGYCSCGKYHYKLVFEEEIKEPE
jgi:hypothetical protein